MMNLYAILTGDLVRSSAIDADRYPALMQALQQCLLPFSPPGVATPVVYRGDGFQLATLPAQAFNAALYTRLTLISQHADARIAIAVAPAEHMRADLNQSTGQAFTLSGQLLDSLQETRWQWLDPQQPLSQAEQLMLQLVSVQLQQLTARQATVLLTYLQQQRPQHQQLAVFFNTSRANITHLLNQAQYSLIGQVVDYFANRYQPCHGVPNDE
jgi:hypothetical protein